MFLAIFIIKVETLKEMVESILLFIGMILFIIYCILMFFLNGKKIPESLSATSYILKEQFGTTIPFTILCIVCAATAFPKWVEISPNEYQCLAFLSCAGIIFAGSTPLYKEEFESKIHCCGGIIAFVSGLLWLIATVNWLTLISVIIIGGIWSLFDKKNYTFIFETIVYLSIAFLLLLNY